MQHGPLLHARCAAVWGIPGWGLAEAGPPPGPSLHSPQQGERRKRRQHLAQPLLQAVGTCSTPVNHTMPTLGFPLYPPQHT